MKSKIKFQEILLNETIALTSTVTTPRSSYENTSSTYSNPSPHPIDTYRLDFFFKMFRMVFLFIFYCWKIFINHLLFEHNARKT